MPRAEYRCGVFRVNHTTNPHQNQPVLRYGEPLEQAKAVMLMAHGRGATAEGILTLSRAWRADGVAFVAPQAQGNSWWPNRFIDPLESNQPWLTSALAAMETALASVAQAGIPSERTLLLGFSQGACLVLEFAARHARRYGGVAGLSGGLIGPDGTPRDYAGSLDGTPVFLGCSDVDFHIPKARVQHSADVLERMGARVTTRLYANMEHTINEDELAFLQGMILDVLKPR